MKHCQRWEFRHLSRTELAPNGRVNVNGCRLFLEEMADAGLIVLPPKKAPVEKKIINHTKAPPLPAIEINCSLSRLRPVTIDPVPQAELALWNSTMATHHPLGFQ